MNKKALIFTLSFLTFGSIPAFSQDSTPEENSQLLAQSESIELLPKEPVGFFGRIKNRIIEDYNFNEENSGNYQGYEGERKYYDSTPLYK